MEGEKKKKIFGAKNMEGKCWMSNRINMAGNYRRAQLRFLLLRGNAEKNARMETLEDSLLARSCWDA